MTNIHETIFFTDAASGALKDLNKFMIRSASEDYPSVKELKNLLEEAIESIHDSESSLYFILDAAHENLTSKDWFPEDFDKLINELMDSLNDADPVLRVKHNLSDQWSVIEKLDGGGLLESIAYFSSPNMADQFINYISTTELRS